MEDEIDWARPAASSGALGWARHGGAIASYHHRQVKVREISEALRTPSLLFAAAPMSWPYEALKD
jgi:hypothetical protein